MRPYYEWASDSFRRWWDATTRLNVITESAMRKGERKRQRHVTSSRVMREDGRPVVYLRSAREGS